ncbi:MAG TPA: maleylpyruvate isomerase N-terminal domain-containing protein [Actinomycetota bacterium]|nr:maleylpyruvate isomerase N-terminal domain-containing protein [Actinomycetota bacterium]
MQPSKQEVIGAVAAQRARTIALVEPLTAAQWDAPALPGWRVREVAGHLVASDQGALTGRMLRVGMRPQPDGGLEAVEAWNEAEVHRWSDRPAAEIVEGLRTWGRRSVALFKATPATILRRTVPLPFGKVPLLFLGQIRVFDEWVHEQDIRRALQMDPGYDLPSLTAAARALLAVMPLQTPVRMPADTKGTLSVRFDGIDVPPLFVDLLTKEFGFDGGNVDATVTGTAPALIFSAANRDAWRDHERGGTIRIDGDRAVGEAFLDAMRAG